MKPGKKLVLLSTLLLASSILGACSQKDFDSLFAPDRRLPEGAEVNFDNRHTPMLNPNQGQNGIKHVPVENMSPASSNGQPVALNPMQTENIYPVIQKSPVVPVATGDIPPPPATPAASAAYPTLASVPAAPAKLSSEQVKADFGTMAEQQQSSEAGRKILMADSSAVVMTSPATGKLVANPANASAPAAVQPAIPPAVSAIDLTTPPSVLSGSSGSIKDMHYASSNNANTINNSNPVSMDMPASKPGSGSDNGFSNWLHSTFSQNKPASSSGMADNPTDGVRKVPVENASLLPVSNTPPAPVPVQPASVTAPVAVVNTVSAPAAVPIVPASKPVASLSFDSPSLNTGKNGVSPPDMAAQVAVHDIAAPQAIKPPVTDTAAAKPDSASWLNNLFANNKRPDSADKPATGNIVAESNTTPHPAADSQPAVMKALPAADNTPAKQPLTDNSKVISPVVSTSTLPDISTMSAKTVAPVNLVQPSGYSVPPTGYGYMEESRYSNRSSEEN